MVNRLTKLIELCEKLQKDFPNDGNIQIMKDQAINELNKHNIELNGKIMQYNKRVENIIDKFEFDDFRKNDQNSEYIFDLQIETAKEIILSYTNFSESSELDEHNRHAILYAQMQSGKTGVCSALINILNVTKLKTYFNIEKYLFITGMNDKGLQLQTKDRLINQIIDLDESKINANVKKESNKHLITIYKNNELRNSKLNLKNTFIIIDESHYGTDKSINVLNKFFSKNGINWKNDESLEKNNTYILSVSATPFNELVSDIQDSKNKIFLPVEPEYYGLNDFDQMNLIYDANNSKEEINSFIEDCLLRMNNDNKKGVVFLRTRNNIQIDSNIWDVEYLDSSYEQINYKYINVKIDNLIYNPNTKPLLIIIKGAYRAGITINSEHKSYVYGVYDYSKKREATLQGLIGRMCGYRNNQLINTKFYINKSHLNDYIQFINGNKEYEVFGKKNMYKLSRFEHEIIPLDDKLELDENGIKSKEQLNKWLLERTKFPEFEFENTVYNIKNKFIINLIPNDEKLLKNIENNGSGFLKQEVFKMTVSGVKLGSSGGGFTIKYTKKSQENNLNKIFRQVVYNVPTKCIFVIYKKLVENKKLVTIGDLIEIKKT